MGVRGCFVLGSARVKALDALKKERRRKKKKKKAKMTKVDFHRFLVRHFSKIFEPSYGYCEDRAMPESRSECPWAYIINRRVKYRRVNKNP